MAKSPNSSGAFVGFDVGSFPGGGALWSETEEGKDDFTTLGDEL
jgi:hypothetical protein